MKRSTSAPDRRIARRSGFTLVELMIGLPILIVVLGVAGLAAKRGTDAFAQSAAIDALDENNRLGFGGPLVERRGQMRPRDEAHPLYPFKKDDPTFF